MNILRALLNPGVSSSRDFSIDNSSVSLKEAFAARADRGSSDFFELFMSKLGADFQLPDRPDFKPAEFSMTVSSKDFEQSGLKFETDKNKQGFLQILKEQPVKNDFSELKMVRDELSSADKEKLEKLIKVAENPQKFQQLEKLTSDQKDFLKLLTEEGLDLKDSEQLEKVKMLAEKLLEMAEQSADLDLDNVLEELIDLEEIFSQLKQLKDDRAIVMEQLEELFANLENLISDFQKYLRQLQDGVEESALDELKNKLKDLTEDSDLSKKLFAGFFEEKGNGIEADELLKQLQNFLDSLEKIAELGDQFQQKLLESGEFDSKKFKQLMDDLSDLLEQIEQLELSEELVEFLETVVPEDQQEFLELFTKDYDAAELADNLEKIRDIMEQIAELKELNDKLSAEQAEKREIAKQQFFKENSEKSKVSSDRQPDKVDVKNEKAVDEDQVKADIAPEKRDKSEETTGKSEEISENADDKVEKVVDEMEREKESASFEAEKLKAQSEDRSSDEEKISSESKQAEKQEKDSTSEALKVDEHEDSSTEKIKAIDQDELSAAQKKELEKANQMAAEETAKQTRDSDNETGEKGSEPSRRTERGEQPETTGKSADDQQPSTRSSQEVGQHRWNRSNQTNQIEMLQAQELEELEVQASGESTEESGLSTDDIQALLNEATEDLNLETVKLEQEIVNTVESSNDNSTETGRSTEVRFQENPIDSDALRLRELGEYEANASRPDFSSDSGGSNTPQGGERFQQNFVSQEILKSEKNQQSYVDKMRHMERIFEAQKVIEQLAEKTRAAVKEGRQTMQIQLHPQELGEVRVEIAVEGSRMTARFRVENELVEDRLGRNLRELENCLTEIGLEIDEVEISNMETGSGSDFEKWFDDNQPGNQAESTVEGTAEMEESAAGPPSRRGLPTYSTLELIA